MKEILLIENDQSLIELTFLILQKRNFKIKILNQPDQIFDLLRKYKPDLIILDNLVQGKITGIELANQLKADQNFADIPILLTTGQNLTKAELGKGPDDYLKKPFDPDALIQRINNLLKT